MKKLLLVSVVILGLLAGTQQIVSEKDNLNETATIVPENVLEDFESEQRLLLAGNVPCNPAKQVCED